MTVNSCEKKFTRIQYDRGSDPTLNKMLYNPYSKLLIDGIRLVHSYMVIPYSCYGILIWNSHTRLSGSRRSRKYSIEILHPKKSWFYRVLNLHIKIWVYKVLRYQQSSLRCKIRKQLKFISKRLVSFKGKFVAISYKQWF